MRAGGRRSMGGGDGLPRAGRPAWRRVEPRATGLALAEARAPATSL